MANLRRNPSATITVTSVGVVLRSDLGTFQLGGDDVRAFLEKIWPLLDGTRDAAAVAAALPAYTARSVTTLLDVLVARGLVEPASGDRLAGEHAFLRRWPDGDAAVTRFAGARVTILGETAWCDVAARELENAGVTVSATGGSLVLASTDRDDLDELIARSHELDAPCLWSHLGADVMMLGPLVVRGHTPCRACARSELNPPIGGRSQPSSHATLAARLLGALVAAEAIKLVTRYTPSPLGGRVVIRDLMRHTTQTHTLVRLPWCRMCGSAAAPQP